MPIQIVHTQGGTSVTTAYSYDGNGTRVKKSINGGGETSYIGAHYELYDTGSQTIATKYIFAGNTRVAMIKDTDLFFFHKDHLGSSTVMTTDLGAAYQTTDYLPFGGQRGTGSITISAYKFTDQEHDAEIGLYNYNARLYDPVVGFFMSADTIVPNFSDPQSLNRYSYCRNNPLIYVDPSGHDFGLSILVGAIVGAIVSGSQSDWNPGAMLAGAVIGGAAGYMGFVGNTWGVDAALAAGWGKTSTIMVGAMTGGIAAGGTAGGLGAAYYGGDVGQGMLQGAGYGAISGAAFGGIGGHFGDTWDLWRVGAHTIAGGGMAELTGNNFGDGAIFAGGAAFARYAYNKFIGFDTSWEKGSGYQNKGRMTWPEPGYDHTGAQGYGNDPNGWCNEGGKIGRTLNYVPGIPQGVSPLHDAFNITVQRYFTSTAREIFNYPLMLPAAAVSYSALLTDQRAIIMYSVDPTKYRK